MRDAVLTLRVCKDGGFRRAMRLLTAMDARRAAATPARLHARLPDPAIRSRAEADVARPGCAQPAGLAFRAAKLSTNAEIRVRNNHPLGKHWYDQRLLLAPVHRFRWSEKAADTGLSNGVQMLVHSATDGSTKTPAIRCDGAAAAASASELGLKA
jgi:hypothetical protein